MLFQRLKQRRQDISLSSRDIH